MRFAGKTVIVTGAGSGIGEATAQRFAREGANVVLVGRRKGALESAAKGFDDKKTLICSADVSDLKAVEAFVAATVEKFGGLDVLVNNAAVATSGSFGKSPLEDWHKTMSINVAACSIAAVSPCPTC